MLDLTHCSSLPPMGKKGKKPTATQPETVLDAVDEEEERVLTLLEVDPATENPALLDAIRNKNSAALTSMLDSHAELSAKDISNAAHAVWYLVMNGHHITGNLNLLMNPMPVCDRWVRALAGTGPPMQVCARGSVNCNGIKLDDVWYVPGATGNMVATAQLTKMDVTVMMCHGCSIARRDGTIFGKGHVKGEQFVLDFLDAISETPWYLVSNAVEHMTGNLHLLSSFTPTRPDRPVRTHTGEMLQVCGKGSLSSTQLDVPGVSYVPGLTENIISVTQLIDSGFSVTFGPDGCTVTRNRGGDRVGYVSHAGGQLYRVGYLRVAASKYSVKPNFYDQVLSHMRCQEE